MEVRDLVRALLAFRALDAREWVAEAGRRRLRWSYVAAPTDLSEDELALAAGLVELLAERAKQQPPPWTRGVGASRTPVYLVRAAESMPRLRASCEREGPEQLRSRGFFAPPEFLTTA